MKLPTPDPASDPLPQITLYRRWLADQRDLSFPDYAALHQWSIDDLPAFWQSIWDYFDLQSPTPITQVLDDQPMPLAKWFTGATLNYAKQVFRHTKAAGKAQLPAIVSMDEAALQASLNNPSDPAAQPVEMSWDQLQRQVALLALHLQRQGVQAGDRVVAYLPNTPQTVVAFLAVASLGAIWSVCSPDMGVGSVLDRFKQIQPKVLIARSTVIYNGQSITKGQAIQALVAQLPSVSHLILDDGPTPEQPSWHANQALLSDILMAGDSQAASDSDHAIASAVQAFKPLPVPFDHPLWIVYSSGTTGLPKPIVHGHGGVVLVALAMKCLHNDVGCSYHANTQGERYFWYSTTGWVMWNAQLSGLLTGTTICLFDGNPGGTKQRPDWGTLWRFAALTKVSYFGAGAAFYANCQKNNLDLSTCGDLHRVRALGSTGSPLSDLAQQWGTAQFEQLGRPGIWWCNLSGGTDFAGAFIGGNRELPQVPGAMQCRLLGCAVEAWDESGQAVIDQVGELVCTRPIPSMPLYLWGDNANARYLASYFDHFPGVWRHGDWLKIQPDGSCIIYGRSDATINRHGLRLGTSEIYNAVESLPEVVDSMVIDLEYLGRPSYMPLFVVLREALVLDDNLSDLIRTTIRQSVSPRFVPDDIIQVQQIPRTLTGKKQELPIKKLFLGQALEKVINREAMANPECLAWYQTFANQYLARNAKD